MLKRPYRKVSRGAPPSLVVLIAVAALLLIFPLIALLLRDLALR